MTNKRRVLRMADDMAQEVKSCQNIGWRIPAWAGLAWIIDPYYFTGAHNVQTAFGPEWWLRAQRLCKALAIASQWKGK